MKISAVPKSVSRDFGKPDVSRHFTSGIDWATAGLATAPAARPVPAAVRNWRRFMELSSDLGCDKPPADRVAASPAQESASSTEAVQPPETPHRGGRWRSRLAAFRARPRLAAL